MVLTQPNYHILGTYWTCFLNILMIQEHWINDKQLESFANLFPGYSVNSKSAIDSSHILRGRPYGGVAIIYPDSLSSSATFINSKSDILCALSLDYTLYSVVFILHLRAM